MSALSRLLFAGFSIGGIAAGLTGPAHATLQFTAGIPGSESSFTCVDNDPTCDSNPVSGTLAIANMSVDGFVATDVLVQSAGNSDNPADPMLSYSVGAFTNNSGQDLVADFAGGDTDYRGPLTLDLKASVSWLNPGNSSITFAFFADPDNTQGGNTPTDAPGMDLDDGQFEGSQGNKSFASTVDLTGTGLYSLSDAGTLFLAAGATISGGQSSMLSSVSPAVPEPSTWAMMALGFAGLGFVGYRRARLRPAAV
jgi:hypothetical protein